MTKWQHANRIHVIHDPTTGKTTHPRQTTGRCHRCRIRFVWEGKPLLRDAYCPYCGSPLQLTTRQWMGKTEYRTPSRIPR
jgi:rRNA maturation endonuclease Nob1